MHELFDRFTKKLEPDELAPPLAKGFVKYILSLEDGTAILKEIREDPVGDVWVFLDVNVSQPNKPAFALRNTEPLAIHFHAEDALPGVYSCREDFPDTPHQNWVPEGAPYCLCIDNRPWVEIKATYTSSELLHRIALWLRRAGRGELHGAEQPLDPNFLTGKIKIVVPEEVFLGGDEGNEYAADLLDEDKTIVRVVKIDKNGAPPTNIKRFNTTFLPFSVPPEAMSRLRHAPTTLSRLQEEMATRGIDIYEGVKENIKVRSRDNNAWKRVWYHSHFILLIKMPLINPTTGEINSAQTIAFALNKSVGEVGVALGVLGKNPLDQEEIPYTLLVHPEEPDLSELADIGIDVASVIPHFEANLAALMAGREKADMRRAVLVGAGSVGSLVAESLVREGRFEMTIVDSDVLLPHNLARHALLCPSVGKKKAKALADYLRVTRLGCDPSPHVADILKQDLENEDLAFALHDAQIILDASASVPVSRHLSDMTVDGRRASLFYSPGGEAAVLMVEDCKRRIDIRHLEAALYATILMNVELRDLFTGLASVLQYSGNCGDLSVRMSASKAQILSGLLARGLGDALDSNDAVLRIWKLEKNGSVSVHGGDVSEPIVYRGEWCVRVSRALAKTLHHLRLSKLPRETGGALLGIVDIPRKHIDILSALPAPPDSEEGTTEFQRGVVGLREQFEDAVLRTLNQIRYVGEWHSHPRGYSTSPSGFDLKDLATMTATLSMDGCPGVQLILGDADEMRVVLGIAKENE